MADIQFTGEHLRRIRMNLRLSQSELAVYFGMKQEQICRWENMTTNIPRQGMILHALKNIHREILSGPQRELLRKYVETAPEVMLMAMDRSEILPRKPEKRMIEWDRDLDEIVGNPDQLWK